MSQSTSKKKLNPPPGLLSEVTSGKLQCTRCQSEFPILAGVALLVNDVRDYLLTHVKGIAQVVRDHQIPREYLRDFQQAKAALIQEHIEEDLEAERVNALYVMNHYLRVKGHDPKSPWWRPIFGSGSSVIDSLVREHWDQGPFSQIEKWVKELPRAGDVVELGCGVGGLYRVLKPSIQSYLGVDSSFASVSLARHLALGMPYSGKIEIPEDLLRGPVSRAIRIQQESNQDGNADFVVGDLEGAPLPAGSCDLTIALNAIDMLGDPELLPVLQRSLLRASGRVIQSCPYIWHGQIAQTLRKKLPKEINTSARAAEWLYEKAGFKIQQRVEHQPWLFFKNVRQLEVYSVHLFISSALTS